MPFLACTDLAVFKAFFNRTKDWADLEEMAEAGTLDRQTVIGALAEYLGLDDPASIAAASASASGGVAADRLVQTQGRHSATPRP